MKKIFYSILKELSHLDGISSLLDWDQQVYMPKNGGENRSSQLELIALLRHERLTNPALEDAANHLSQDRASTEEDRVNAQGVLRVIQREKKLPKEFISEKSKASSEAFQCWSEAKPSKDFKKVKSELKRIIDLSKEEVNYIGYTEHPYDALLDNYEWGGRVSWVYPALKSLSSELIPLVQTLSEKTKGWGSDSFPLEKEKQISLNEKIMTDMGMVSGTARLDASAHPFCTTIGLDDYRITTRFDENNFLSALLSTLHETGHSLYEAGLPGLWRGTPCGSAVSLGIHESQSRFYENMIGRSREFSRYLSRMMNQETLSDKIWTELNQVKPSLIRVEADEVSYSLHVLLRMELEIALIKGDLSIEDLPSAWNDKYKEYLGVVPANHAEGVLQDVHWYSGAIGYFSTYVLGNIYSGMLLEKINKDLPNFYSYINSGNFKDILSWLRINIHEKGQREEPRSLIEGVVGKEINSKPFVDYLKNKFELV